MFAISRTITLPGVSSTGTKHDVQLDFGTANDLRFTILGANGKRHAASIVGDEWADTIVEFLKDEPR